MKILLVSDTHGHIHYIADYSLNAGFDACIHAGDFGFYDETSAESMSQRELYLQIKHSDLPTEEKNNLLQKNAAVWGNAVKTHHLLGEFDEYLAGRFSFPIPVYAVWGNHDDAAVVMRLQKHPIKNLRLIHDRTHIELGEFAVLGVGGNCVLNSAFTQGGMAIPGARCRPASAWRQYQALIRTADALSPRMPKILLMHVSPLVEPFLELLAWRIGAVLTVSGHMGYPNGEVGHTDCSQIRRMNAAFENVLALYPAFAGELQTLHPQEKEHCIEHVNLPDAENGYGVLELSGTVYSVQINRRT